MTVPPAATPVLPQPTAASAPPATPSLDRWFWLALLLAALVVLPRSVLISRAHSETLDEQAHLRRGFAAALGNPGNLAIQMNDPPFGDVLLVLPPLLLGASPEKPIVWRHWPGGRPDHADDVPEHVAARQRVARNEVLYGHAASPETLLLSIALWKAILFLPFAGLVFHVVRRLYGLPSAWLAFSLILIDPTFAAHTPIAALDVLAVEAILLACYLAWRYFESPAPLKLIAAAASAALALSIKHTALAVPPILLAYALAFWLRSRHLRRSPAAALTSAESPNPRLPPRRHLALFILVFCFTMWSLTLFDISAPRNWMWAFSYPPGGGFNVARDFLDPLLDLRWPGGIYIGSFIGGLKHSRLGHWSFLLGQNNPHGGWWYYFPVVATYKIPLGFFPVFLFALASLRWNPPRFGELALLIPAVAYCAMLISTPINIGFRHFLPPLCFLYMLAARSLAPSPLRPLAPSPIRIFLWLSIAASFLHTLTYHPDYLSYLNFPRRNAWRDIADSNIDWGQSLKQVRRWLDRHPTDRPVYLGYFWNEKQPGIRYYLGDRVTPIARIQGIPPAGLLIISPNWVNSIFDYNDSFAELRALEPIDIIGHNMLVYDLDPLHRDPPATRATTRP